MAKALVRITRSFVHTVPEKRISYTKGDTHEFKSKKAAFAFIAAHEKANPGACLLLASPARLYASPPKGHI